MYTVTTDNTKIHLDEPSHWSGIIDPVTIVYDYLFSSEDSIIEKNKYIILFVQRNIQNAEFKTIVKFLNDSSISDLDISILYSISIIIRQFNQLKEQSIKLEKLIADKV